MKRKEGLRVVVWVIFDHFKGLATCKSGFSIADTLYRAAHTSAAE
jgi:hypothetical protein